MARVALLPRTTLGRVSVWFLVVGLVSFALFWIAIAAGQRGGETFFSNLWLTIPYLAWALASIAGGGVGVAGMVRDRERAVLVWLAVVVGALVLWWAGAELLFPH